MNRTDLLCVALFGVWCAHRHTCQQWHDATPSQKNALTHIVYFWECADPPMINDSHLPQASLIAWNRQVTRDNETDLKMDDGTMSHLLATYLELRSTLS
jgi:hypothetical protein